MSYQTKTKTGGRLPSLKAMLTGVSVSVIAFTSMAYGQDAAVDEVVVSGIRKSLEDAIDQKRNASSLVEVILAEDIGKLPDQNLAEVLENVTGIQVTRTAGVGTGVQIRGTNANRVEINGVSTVGSGAGRSGIDFEDVNAAIISGVEITKSPEAKTIEGSVGGTVNLKTIRPLDLTDTLGVIRIQAEENNLSTESAKPRYSGAYGDIYELSNGAELGFVISGSITEQEAVSFRPRADRDNVASPSGADPANFLGMQFLLQEQENDDYETTNIASSVEYAPNDNLKLFADIIINEQERSRDQYRLQASGISSLRQLSIPTEFETVDFGIDGTNSNGVNLRAFPAALKGTLEPDLDNDDDDPNLRFSSETGSRVTDSQVLAVGAEYSQDKWDMRFEFAQTSADTTNPTLNTTLNFINPNCPLDGDASGDPSTSNDNCVPFIYDLSGKSLAFGVNFDSPYAPDVEDLTNPANVVLDQVDVGRNTNENSDDAIRADFSYDLSGNPYSDLLTSVDFGIRTNESSSKFEDIDDRIGGFSKMEDSPRGSLFSSILVNGPTNYGDADGRSLFIKNFLLVDPDRSFSDPDGVIAVLESALATHRENEPQADGDLEINLESDKNSYYDITEETLAYYAQVNFEGGNYSGNVGFRFVDTSIDSTAYGPADSDGDRSLQTTSGSYDFLLPRANLTVTPREDLVIRAGYTKDIRRPDFDDLNTGYTLDPSENAVVALGNPGLEPEEVDSYDVSVDWYFKPAAVLSVGLFEKKRTNIFGIDLDGALLVSSSTTTGGFARETDQSCPGGGIYNPIVVPNQLGDPNQLGLCVDVTRPGNDSETTTQEGIELAIQYDLSEWEDELGDYAWVSGFGVLANYTSQDFSGGGTIDSTSGRGLNVLGAQDIARGLLDFSETAYNLTVFYEKYGLSARARYTWREAFRTQDYAGGANSSGSSTFSFPVWTLDRSQLNASISYDVNENLTLGLEGVNLTKENIYQHAVAKTGPLAFAGYPDRRIIFGETYRY